MRIEKENTMGRWKRFRDWLVGRVEEPREQIAPQNNELSKYLPVLDAYDIIYRLGGVHEIDGYWQTRAKVEMQRQVHQCIADGDIALFGYHRNNLNIRVRISREFIVQGYEINPVASGCGCIVQHHRKLMLSEETWFSPEFLREEIESKEWESPKPIIDDLQERKVELDRRVSDAKEEATGACSWDDGCGVRANEKETE